jgi:carbonic anhydrase
LATPNRVGCVPDNGSATLDPGSNPDIAYIEFPRSTFSLNPDSTSDRQAEGRLKSAWIACQSIAESNRDKEINMSKIVNEVLAANQNYASSFGDKGKLPMPPGRHFAILTCMDARLDPAKYAGLAEGDAHVIRNAGGRASDDAIRSLVISYKLLGTREWFVIHHTDCGMQTFTDDIMRKLLRSSLKTARVDASGWHDVGDGGGSTEGDYISWLTIPNLEQSVIEDVQRIRSHPLVPGNIPIYGYIYDVRSGKLTEVPEATVAGQIRSSRHKSGSSQPVAGL